MLMGQTVAAPTIAAAWVRGLQLFSSPTMLYRHDSERGVAFEIPGMTLVVESIEDVSLPSGFRYPALVTDYAERVFGAQRYQSMTHSRIRNWRRTDGTTLDQIAAVVELLRRSSETRTAAISLWEPEQDLNADFPVSPVAGGFRVIDGQVALFLVARSVDYWVGAVPEMIVFAQLQAEVADRLRRRSGAMTYHMWSAHIYEDDCLANLAQSARTE
jgi:hypothetical protein